MRAGSFPSGTLCHIEIRNSALGIRQIGRQRGYSLWTMSGCNKIVLTIRAKDSHIVGVRRSKVLCKKRLALLPASKQFLGSKIGPRSTRILTVRMNGEALRITVNFKSYQIKITY
jgi:hypothetical protein